MSLLYQGDRLPSVTTSQILMQRYMPHAEIKADGIYGRDTRSAVVAFQKYHNLVPDGIIGRNTWRAYSTVSGFVTIDVVDNADANLNPITGKPYVDPKTGKPYDPEEYDLSVLNNSPEIDDLRGAGFDPIVVNGMSDGVDYVMDAISAKAGSKPIFLLRIHGHGHKGVQNVTGGLLNGSPHMSAISLDNFGAIEGSLLKIKNKFVPFGSVQLMGCQVGGGQGPALLRRLADTWEVPVSAAVHDQWSSGSYAFRFQGPVVSGFPGGLLLASWSKSMQEEYGNKSG